MKILFDYTVECIKRNRRSSISIMIAILMASTMLSALCGFFFNLYSDNLRYVLEETGNWHGELFDNTTADKLEIVERFDGIEATMIKGNWKVAKIEDPRREYLIWRDANSAYWNSMPEGNSAVLEGRIPSAPDEVVLSKQYFEHHPDLKIGDIITLPLGSRISSDGSPIEAVEKKQEGEYFSQTGIVSLTVVGKHDVTTSSIVPAYTALGYLSDESIVPEDEVTVYFRFENIYDTYQILPKIAKAIGYKMDEFGEYNLRYNTDYLSRRGVLSPMQINALSLLLASQMPIMFAVMGFLAVGVFVLIIHNAFYISVQSRLHQLGIFASIGATPKQIKRSVRLEGLLLCVVPLPLGIFLGQISVVWLMNFVANTSSTDTHMVGFVMGWQSVLPAILLTLLTVWWSASIPARKISKLSPITAILEGEAEVLRKAKGHSIWKLFGLSAELAGNALYARKKSYRTATISLTLSFLILCVFLCINSASTASMEIYQSNEKKWEDQDILISLYNVQSSEDLDGVIKKIRTLETLQSNRWYNEQSAAAWLPDEAFSKEFHDAGGFEAAEKILSSGPIPFKRESKYRVLSNIVGMEDETFKEYCEILGIDWKPFYHGNTQKAIWYNTIEDVTSSTKRNSVEIPYLNFAAGDTIWFTEKTRDDYNGDYRFPIEISAVADKLPPLGSNISGGRYYIKLFMPMSRLNKLAQSFTSSGVNKISGVLCAKNVKQITSTSKMVEQICDSYFGSGDYRLFDEEEYRKNESEGNKMVVIMFGFVSGLLAVIGLSNTWFTVQGTLSSRRREFAMFRSMGLSPKEFQKMLCYEAVLFGAAPILISLPFVFLLQTVFLRINEVTFFEWIPFAPWIPVLFYIGAVLTVVILAYMTGGKKLLRENIMEAIKLERV